MYKFNMQKYNCAIIFLELSIYVNVNDNLEI